MGRCRNLGSRKSFLWYAPQLSGASILYFVILYSLWGHYWGLLQFDPDAGKDWGQEKERQQRMKWLYGIISSMGMNLSKLWETVKGRKPWCAAVHGVAISQIWLSDWTATTYSMVFCLFVSFLCSQRTHQFTHSKGGDCNHWWLWYPLFTDMGSSIYFSTVKVLITRKIFCNCVG